MTSDENMYQDYVNHPRYGRGPRFTGQNPSPMDPETHLHWNSVSRAEIAAAYKSATGEPWPYSDLLGSSSNTSRIAGTAVIADLQKQTQATIPVTHYFDLNRCCHDCSRQFIFFAEEQKHWYEELGFSLNSDCVRCSDCRKSHQQNARLRKRYEALFHQEPKSESQLIELASCCIQLVERGLFSTQRMEFARCLLNKIQPGSEVRSQQEYAELVERSRSKSP